MTRKPEIGSRVLLNGTVSEVSDEGLLTLTVDNGHHGDPFFVYRIDPRAVFVVRRRAPDLSPPIPVDDRLSSDPAERMWGIGKDGKPIY